MMTPLRRRMLEDLKRHNLAERTQQSYRNFIARLARHFGVSPNHSTREQLKLVQLLDVLASNQMELIRANLLQRELG